MERARSTSPPSSTSPCPACGTSVDTLRAGHVAMFEGGFRYFCDASCKSSWVDSSSKRAALDAFTADPPMVASSVRLAPPAIIVAADETSPPRTPRTLRSGEEAVFLEVASRDEPVLAASRTQVDPPPTLNDPASALALPAALADAPPTFEPSVESRDASRSTAEGGSMLALLALAVPLVGIVAGLLTAAIGLAGESANVARLPFAIVATAALLLRLALPRHENADPEELVVVVPVMVAVVAAAAFGHDAHATFAGLAAAAALVVDSMMTRARREVDMARAQTAAALAVVARVVRGEEMSEVEASAVKPGEQVLVEAGEVVPVDGLIAAGTAEVAPWLDSSVVVDKREGDAIVAGAAVVSGRLRVTATFTADDRAWLKRVDRTAPLVAFSRKNALLAAPVGALILAGAAFASNGSLADVLVAGCAGSFVVASLAGIRAAALAHARAHVAAQRRGIVYKDGSAFDFAARADVAILCSRGTILLGEPEIVAIEAASVRGMSTEKNEVVRVLSLAAGAEMASSHPFAAAILRLARARSLSPETVRSALKHSGRGVTALAPNGDKIVVGNRGFLLEEKVSVAVADGRISELEGEGRSVLAVALGGRLVGIIALQDGLRPGARAAVHRLHAVHIEPVLLTGESRDTSETIARALDVEHVRPEILPADRGAEVRALADGGHVVAAIGHTHTDDGALGAADVSVAMGAAGSAPGEWAVALASDDVRDAALALTVPRAARERARIAVLLAAAAQAIAALAVAFGVVSPVLVPVVAVLAALLALAVVRDPVVLSG